MAYTALFFLVTLYVTTVSAENASNRVWVNDGDGLRNGSFEYWLEGEPLFWNVSPEFKPLLSKKPTAPQWGGTALGFWGDCEECWAETELKFDRPPAGLTLVFTIQARTTRTEGLDTFIDYGEVTGRSIAPQTHPGDGRWHVFEQALTLPRNFSETRIHVGFRYTGHSGNAPWGILDNAAIHVLPDVNTNRRELIRDIQFRHWNDGAPAGWRVLKGKVSRIAEASQETSSLQLDAPGNPNGEEVKLQLPLLLYAIDAGKTLQVKLTTKSPKHVLRIAIYGRVDGKTIPFAYEAGAKKGYALIRSSEEWLETKTDFLVPENLESQSVIMFLHMNSSATQPVEIQRISAIAIPVGTEK